MIDEYIYFLTTTRAEDLMYLKTLSQQFIIKGYSKNDAMYKAVGEAVMQAKLHGGLIKLLKYINENYSAEEAS